MKKKRYLLRLFFAGFIFFIFINTALAQNMTVDQSGDTLGIPFIPQIPIPGFAVDRVMGDGSTLAGYIIAIYQYGASVAGLVAMFMLVLAGWKWLMAAGNPEKIAAAKDTIQGAVVGLILLFGSYLLLAQISSRLITFADLRLINIEREVPPTQRGCSDLTEEVCNMYLGCIVENGVCVQGPSLCHLSSERVQQNPAGLRCCRKTMGDSQYEYTYAIVSFNQLCDDVCGSGWLQIDNSTCRSNLGY